MSEPKKPSDLMAASFEALERYEAAQEALSEAGDRPPAPGDVYVLESTRDFGVEWAVIAHDPADASQYLVIPADPHVLAGSADVEVAAGSHAGALALHCRFGAWTDARPLRPELRVGTLSREELIRARQLWFDLGDGAETGDVLAREVDDDPGYQDWVVNVLVPARQALLTEQAREAPPAPSATAEPSPRPTPMPTPRPPGSMFFRIAASIIVAVISVQLWRLGDQVQNLETASKVAKERHGAVVEQLETERDRLMAERDRLQRREQELVASGQSSERKAQELRDRVAALDRQLSELELSSEVVNPGIAVFGLPDETLRGKEEVTLSPEQRHVVLFLQIRDLAPAPRYQLEVRPKGTATVIWTNDQLVIQGAGEIRVGLPARVLEQVEYELRLLAIEDGGLRQIGEYELVVFRVDRSEG